MIEPNVVFLGGNECAKFDISVLWLLVWISKTIIILKMTLNLKNNNKWSQFIGISITQNKR